MMKIKVLQYTGAMNRGGAETLLMNLLRNINQNNFEFYFVSHTKEICHYDEEIISLGGKIIYIDKPNFKNIYKYKNDFSSIVKEYGPFDVIHSHLQLMNGLILKEAKKNNIPCRISHAHLNGDYAKTSFLRILFRLSSKLLISKYSTHKLACSLNSGEYLYGKDNFQLINNAIDLSVYKNIDSSYLYNELGIDNTKKIITHVGTFKEAKNHVRIIDVFSEIIKINTDYRLLLVGDGPLKSKIQMKINELGINDYVYIIGIREDIPEILNISDIFIMPSLIEGLPVALVEAQAAGLMCFISDNIPEECDLGLSLVKRISLQEKDSYWCEQIINQSKNYTQIEERIKRIKDSGFDLNKNVEILTRIYSLKEL